MPLSVSSFVAFIRSLPRWAAGPIPRSHVWRLGESDVVVADEFLAIAQGARVNRRNGLGASMSTAAFAMVSVRTASSLSSAHDLPRSGPRRQHWDLDMRLVNRTAENHGAARDSETFVTSPVPRPKKRKAATSLFLQERQWSFHKGTAIRSTSLKLNSMASR